jgi:hypothetical protein
MEIQVRRCAGARSLQVGNCFLLKTSIYNNKLRSVTIFSKPNSRKSSLRLTQTGRPRRPNGGMFAAHRRMEAGKIQAVIHAAAVAFGFVYMHPFEDGNGRIHRFLSGHRGYAGPPYRFIHPALRSEQRRAFRRQTQQPLCDTQG